MSYKPGELRIGQVCPEMETDGWCEHEPEHEMPMDSRGDYKRTGGAYLPHSCDSWVIGGPENIRALIADLEAALVQLAPSPATPAQEEP